MFADFYRHSSEFDLLAMIEANALNRTRWDALLFFGKNPSAHTRVDAIAQMCGQNERAVEHELDDLMDLGILRANQSGKQKMYALAVEPAVRNAVICFARRSAFD